MGEIKQVLLMMPTFTSCADNRSATVNAVCSM